MIFFVRRYVHLQKRVATADEHAEGEHPEGDGAIAREHRDRRAHDAERNARRCDRANAEQIGERAGEHAAHARREVLKRADHRQFEHQTRIGWCGRRSRGWATQVARSDSRLPETRRSLERHIQ